jgi:adenylate cyclase
MADQKLPEALQRQFGVETVEEMWRKNLTEGNVQWRHHRHIFGLLPRNPRCVHCHRPFEGAGGWLMRLTMRVNRAQKNPRFCADCYGFTQKYPGGAEIELSMLFVDVRGSTTIAEQMNDTQFSHLMNRFYEKTINVLVQADAFIDKLVGDEVTALFIPGFAGREHAHRAIAAGQDLLRVTGHADPQGPWVPVGVGVHTGVAWVGSIHGASGEAADFTALGDNVNISARLAGAARQGEVLASAAACNAAGIGVEGLETRELELKGRREAVRVHVLGSEDLHRS